MTSSQFWPVVWSVVFIVVVSGVSLLLSHWPQRDNVELPPSEGDDGHLPEHLENVRKAQEDKGEL